MSWGRAPLFDPSRLASLCHAIAVFVNRAGNCHMEYVHDRSRFEDPLLERIVVDFHRIYGARMVEHATLLPPDPGMTWSAKRNDPVFSSTGASRLSSW